MFTPRSRYIGPICKLLEATRLVLWGEGERIMVWQYMYARPTVSRIPWTLVENNPVIYINEHLMCART